MQIAFLTALLATVAGAEISLSPRSVTRAELENGVFRPEWRLPDPRELPDRVAATKAMASLVFPERPDALPEYARLRRLGDVVALARDLAGKGLGAETFLAELAEQRPDVLEMFPQLPELLDDSRLGTSRWNPDDDRTDDGICMAPSFDLKKESSTPPWSKLKGNTELHQAWMLLHADLETIKAVENDYRRYPDHVGARYDYIRPVVESYRRGGEEVRAPFAALAIDFQNDLPWPFGSYRCELDILNELDADGHLVTHIWSDSRDFYWMAGRDVFVPLETSEGEWVGFLMLRQFGFDLDGVPERATHRKAALRQGMGNLKRLAEAAFAQREDPAPRTVSGAIPAFEVLGNR